MYKVDELPVPIIFVAILVALALILGMFARPRLALVPIVGMFFVASIAIMKTDWGGIRAQWLYPIQANRSTFYLYFGVLLYPAIIRYQLQNPGRKMAAQAFIIVLISLYVGVTRMVHEGLIDGLTSILFTCCTVLPLAHILPWVLEEWDDFVQLFRGIMVANSLWIAGVVVQMGVNPTMLTAGSRSGSRFIGLTSNPQSAGIFLAIVIMVGIWLFLNDPKRKWRLVWAALVAVNVIMIAWSGSRTGTAMSIIGITAAVYGRAGRTILLLPALAILGVIAYQIAVAFGVDLAIAERLTSTTDTRSLAWISLLETGLEHPLLGVGVGTVGSSENSYLYGFSSGGLGVVALILLLMIVSAVLLLRAIRIRRWLDPMPRALVDLFVGYNCMYFAGGVFEGYIIGRVAAHVVTVLIISSMLSRLLAKYEEEAAMAGAYGAEECELNGTASRPALAGAAGFDAPAGYGQAEYGDYED